MLISEKSLKWLTFITSLLLMPVPLGIPMAGSYAAPVALLALVLITEMDSVQAVNPFSLFMYLQIIFYALIMYGVSFFLGKQFRKRLWLLCGFLIAILSANVMMDLGFKRNMSVFAEYADVLNLTASSP